MASGLENPWEVTWGPDGYLWITERTAFRVTRVNPADGSRHVALVLGDVYQVAVQDGLMGTGPGTRTCCARAATTMCTWRTPTMRIQAPGQARRLRVRRYTYDAVRQTLASPSDVLEDLPAHDDHGGGRLAFGRDGTLYLSRGDQGSNFLQNYCNPIRAQDLPLARDVSARDWSSYQGKLLRLNPDGSIPADNPVLNGVRSHVYTYGHRNVQGLAFGPDNLLYASEHGPSSDDEVNLITAGKNYGWPHVAGFRDDRGTPTRTGRRRRQSRASHSSSTCCTRHHRCLRRQSRPGSTRTSSSHWPRSSQCQPRMTSRR